MTEFQHGDDVAVTLTDGGKLFGNVQQVFESVSGTKVRILSWDGNVVVTVDAKDVRKI